MIRRLNRELRSDLGAAFDTQAMYSPLDFVSNWFMIPVGDKLVHYDFSERPYLEEPYNIDWPYRLLMNGRQTEKTVSYRTLILLENGDVKKIEDVQVGDRVIGLSSDKAHSEVGTVTWKSRRYVKPCVSLETRQGHKMEPALTHPMRAWDKWTTTSEFQIKDKLAVVRKAGRFTSTGNLIDAEIAILAYMIAEGHTPKSAVCSFTQNPGSVLNDFKSWIEILETATGTYREAMASNGKTKVLFFRIASNVRRLCEKHGLIGHLSATKKIPKAIFDLSRKQTALFINRLWASDGHCSVRHGSCYALEYDSTSKRLVQDVQRLLWKFGIPSRIRGWVPALYEGTDKKAYKLHIETSEGVRIFLTEIGALGKSESLPLPAKDSNNNRDTYPTEIAANIKALQESRPGFKRGGRTATQPSLCSAGLRATPKYPPTKQKLQEYIDFFSSVDCDKQLLAQLKAHIDTDLFWDEITEIEDIGEQPCYDITVEGTDSFVADGFITHNSTMVANLLLADSCLIPFHRSLYVSPTQIQTNQFSNDRIRVTVEYSELLKAMLNREHVDRITHKAFHTGSEIRLRYAFQNADRIRGISTDLLVIDEIQDIISALVPIIEETLFTSKHKRKLYSGTPKSTNNTIEHEWRKSTQNEWLVPCDSCATYVKSPQINQKVRHWNILGEPNIGNKGLICAKCGALLNPIHEDSQWVPRNPTPMSSDGKHKIAVPFEGYHISQLMHPAVLNDRGWKELLDKYRDDPRDIFFNECLGLSYDSGLRPLTVAQLRANCDPDMTMADETSRVNGRGLKYWERYTANKATYMGIDWGCYDDQTRILTPRGFVHFKDLTEQDKVAQFDEKTRVMSFVKPEVKTIRDWDGELLHFKTRSGLDQMVTHTHRMLVGDKKDNWHIEHASETVERANSVKFRGYVDWEGQKKNTFTLPALPSNTDCEAYTVPMNAWLEFLGYYLSEGDLYRSKFLGKKAGDFSWTLRGKQLWRWLAENAGTHGHLKRIPREFLELSKDQLRILLDALMLGHPSEAYYSTSKGLCEDVQELCIRLGYCATVALHAEASGDRKARYRVYISEGRDHQFDTPKEKVEYVPYNGKVYCCKVPTGLLVTERDGCVGYQGNTSEGSYTVITIGTYDKNGRFAIFYNQRCVGPDSEPDRQIALIESLVQRFHVTRIGADYGGGYQQNFKLVQSFGSHRLVKFQYSGFLGKYGYNSKLGRFQANRTELMSDIFNALKKGTVFQFPNWNEFASPYGDDIMAIFGEYQHLSGTYRYNLSPGTTDDSFHSIIYCFLAADQDRKRPDVFYPRKAT